MIADLDIYRSAQVLVEQHGENAAIEAAMRADAMLEAGDLVGYAVWKRILQAAETTQEMSEVGPTPDMVTGRLQRQVLAEAVEKVRTLRILEKMNQSLGQR